MNRWTENWENTHKKTTVFKLTTPVKTETSEPKPLTHRYTIRNKMCRGTALTCLKVVIQFFTIFKFLQMKQLPCIK